METATQAEEYRTFLSIFVEQHLILFILTAQAPFWIKFTINSAILNRRDNTDHFIFFLLPFSEGAMEHGLECFLRFYWKPEGESVLQKRIVNGLSLIFGLIILAAIVNVSVEAWINS